MRVMNNVDLAGKRVVSQDGRLLGEIESLDIDIETWRVAALAVKVRKDVLEALSLKRPLIGTQVIRIPADQISGASDTVVLKPAFAALTFEGGISEEGGDDDTPRLISREWGDGDH